MSTKMLLSNPKKSKAKKSGGRLKNAEKRAANKIKNSAAVNRFKNFDFVRNLLIPAAAVAGGILVTRVFKKFVTSRVTSLSPAMQTIAAAGIVTALAYFGKKYIPSSSMVIAGAVAVTGLAFAESKMPNMFSGFGLSSDNDVIVNRGYYPQRALAGADEYLVNDFEKAPSAFESSFNNSDVFKPIFV